MLKPLKMVFGVVLLLLFAGPAFAQTVDTAWVRRYNGTGNETDYGRAITVDDSGYVYVTGRSQGAETSYDYVTIKYRPDGDTAWVRRWNGSANSSDQPYAIAADDSGYAYVTGVVSNSGSSLDYGTIKYYPDGDTAWVRSYDGPGNSTDKAHALVVDDSGYVYVTGSSYGAGIFYDYATIKYHPDGDTVWVRRYNGSANGSDDAQAVAVDGSGHVYVTGNDMDTLTGADYVTIKYDPDGDTAWVRRFNWSTGSSDDRAKAIAVDGSGNVYVTGYTRDGANYDYLTIKYDPDGDTAWVRKYDGPANEEDRASAIAIDGFNNIYVTGHSDSTGTDEDYATIKYDASGNELWVKRFNCANGIDTPYGLAVDGSNDVYVTGMSGCDGATSFDYVTIKYYSNGDTAWVARYHGPVENGNDYAFALALDSAGNVYVTGRSDGIDTGSDYCTIKYVQTTDVKDEAKEQGKPADFSLSQNYPNPFNPSTTMNYSVDRKGLVLLVIYDVLGRQVRTLVNERKERGSYSVRWDGKDDEGQQLSSGVYFYQLKICDYTSSKKMLLLK
jgi:hypothetical protein